MTTKTLISKIFNLVCGLQFQMYSQICGEHCSKHSDVGLELKVLTTLLSGNGKSSDFHTEGSLSRRDFRAHPHSVFPPTSLLL